MKSPCGKLQRSQQRAEAAVYLRLRGRLGPSPAQLRIALFFAGPRFLAWHVVASVIRVWVKFQARIGLFLLLLSSHGEANPNIFICLVSALAAVGVSHSAYLSPSPRLWCRAEGGPSALQRTSWHVWRSSPGLSPVTDSGEDWDGAVAHSRFEQ